LRFSAGWHQDRRIIGLSPMRMNGNWDNQITGMRIAVFKILQWSFDCHTSSFRKVVKMFLGCMNRSQQLPMLMGTIYVKLERKVRSTLGDGCRDSDLVSIRAWESRKMTSFVLQCLVSRTQFRRLCVGQIRKGKLNRTNHSSLHWMVAHQSIADNSRRDVFESLRAPFTWRL
jgi:hypothetical protein